MENEIKEEELNDLEIAELANKEIRSRDEEIVKLKKDLAKLKLLSKGEEEDNEEVVLSRDEIINNLNNEGICSYDYWVNVLQLCDIAASENKPHPLGSEGENVYNFIKDVLEECDGDKTRFHSIYQARLAPDDKSVAMAYNKRKK